MNQVSQHILSIYHYNILLRDSLEYALTKESYNLQAYEQRKTGLALALKEKSPLRNFIDTNGETGKSIETKLNDFIETVYGDASTFLRPSPEGLRVDHAQHLQLFDFIVGLHETLSDITRGYLNFAREKNQSEPGIEKVIADDERLYRSIVFMTVMAEIDKTFFEFNKAMRETKGIPSPQSNYIVGDLKRLVGFLKFQKEHNTVRDEAFNEMMDNSFRAIDCIEGKRELPLKDLTLEEKTTYKGVVTPEGKRHVNFQEVFKENHDVILKVVATSEETWRKSYQPVITELMALTQAAQAAAKPDGKGNA